MRHEGAPPLEESATEANYEHLGQRARVVLDTSRAGEQVPEGTKDEVRAGYAFYEVGEDGMLGTDPMTVDIIDRPELVVVNDKDYENLQGKVIVAKPIRFIWSSENTWRVEF